jgi:hypothetical protein
MTEGFTGIIDQLERQEAAIERALTALREVDGIAPPAPPASVPAARKAGLPPLARNRRSEGQKKRWAAKKAAEAAPAPAPAKPALRKVRITPEGRKRLAEAMRRRWAVKRAASAVKKTGRKQRAGKKAA